MMHLHNAYCEYQNLPLKAASADAVGLSSEKITISPFVIVADDSFYLIMRVKLLKRNGTAAINDVANRYSLIYNLVGQILYLLKSISQMIIC